MLFPHAVNAVRFILLILTLVGTNQCNYSEIATQYKKLLQKRLVYLKEHKCFISPLIGLKSK